MDPERAQFDAFKALSRGEPVEMLNLVAILEQAAYPKDHRLAQAGLSGATAYMRYGEESAPVFGRVGGTIIWSGTPELVVIGPGDEAWDTAFIARYPTSAAFLEMVTDPVYREAVVHRQAAVRTSRLIRCSPRIAAAVFALVPNSGLRTMIRVAP